MSTACPICAAINCTQHKARSKRNGSTRAWRNTRAAVLRRDHYTCQDCGQPATTADHVKSRAHGGTDAMSNLQALCEPCNARKG